MDHAALRADTRIGDGEHRLVAQGEQQAAGLAGLAALDEGEMAGIGPALVGEAPDADRVAVDLLGGGGAVEQRAERVAADDAENEGRAGGGRPARGPGDVAREFRQEGGLDSRFGRLRAQRRCRREAAGQREQGRRAKGQAGLQKRTLAPSMTERWASWARSGSLLS